MTERLFPTVNYRLVYQHRLLELQIQIIVSLIYYKGYANGATQRQVRIEITQREMYSNGISMHCVRTRH
jgi:hypothetical protein